MTNTEILARLEALADEPRRAHNARNGAGDNQIGVKMGDIRKVAKASKASHAQALELWESGIIDARMVAILRMKPKALSTDELDRLARSVTFAYVADWLANYVIKKHPQKEALRQQWMATDDPWTARFGWSLTDERITKAPDGLDLGALLDRVEAQLATADPRVQWTMNMALVAIGIHHPAHRARALAIGEALGVYRELRAPKGCTSPFAPIWIGEMVQRQQARG